MMTTLDRAGPASGPPDSAQRPGRDSKSGIRAQARLLRHGGKSRAHESLTRRRSPYSNRLAQAQLGPPPSRLDS